MPNITNVSQRLVNTHDMVAIPPGATVMISDEAANNATILELINAGVLATAPLHETDNPTVADQPSPTFNTGTEQKPEGRDTKNERPNQPAQQSRPNQPTPNKSN